MSLHGYTFFMGVAPACQQTGFVTAINYTHYGCRVCLSSDRVCNRALQPAIRNRCTLRTQRCWFVQPHKAVLVRIPFFPIFPPDFSMDLQVLDVRPSIFIHRQFSLKKPPLTPPREGNFGPYRTSTCWLFLSFIFKILIRIVPVFINSGLLFFI